MRTTSKCAIAIASVLALSGCAGFTQSYDSAKSMAPSGDAFTQGLFKNYLELSKSELDEYDYRDSDWFADRAKVAAGGQSFPPQEVGGRRIPADRVDVLSGARERLVAALDAGGGEASPEDASRAQAMFDCWMQEQEENHQPDDINACRDGFIASMDKLETAMKPATRAATAAAAAPAAEMAVEARDWEVYFGFNSSELTDAARETLGDVAAYATKFDPKKIRVVLVGHTDTVGSSDYNATLSDRRAEEATLGLIDQGVAASSILLSGEGESNLAVDTPDNTPNAKNRRVAITVKEK